MFSTEINGWRMPIKFMKIKPLGIFYNSTVFNTSITVYNCPSLDLPCNSLDLWSVSRLTVSRSSGLTSIIPLSRFWQSGETKCGMWNTPFFTFSKSCLRLSSSKGRAPCTDKTVTMTFVVIHKISYNLQTSVTNNVYILKA